MKIECREKRRVRNSTEIKKISDKLFIKQKTNNNKNKPINETIYNFSPMKICGEYF